MPRPGVGWPDPMGEAAYVGLAGEAVQLLAPHTEADPAALLVQLLAEFGNAIGRGPHWAAGEDSHYANLFVVLVGRTGKGRKGHAANMIKARLKAVDDVWAGDRVKSGLSSGEGLIHAVRDPQTRIEQADDGTQREVVTDPGVTDKRLLVIEQEFASVLRVASRDGNTLSTYIRSAWDGDTLETMTRNNPLRATGAHISLIGHITAEEIRRELTGTDAANGFANRFLWVCVKRSKQLPEGGELHRENLTPLTRQLRLALDQARRVALIERDDEARERWAVAYSRLTREVPGLFGAITGRAEAQVMRLALLYALLDRAGEIQLRHLEAGLEVWRYCEQSAAYIFGDATGDPVADRIIQALRDEGGEMTQAEVNDLFSGHRGTDRLAAALALLDQHGLIFQLKEATGGRPRIVYKLLEKGEKLEKPPPFSLLSPFSST